MLELLTMKQIAFLIIILVFPFAINANEMDGIWKNIRVGTSDGFEIYLHYRSIASLSDEEWIRLEFKNAGDKTIQIKNARYRIERECFTLDGKTLLFSGSLASGNTSDLFSYAWETTPVSDFLFSPKASCTITEHPSRYSSALLDYQVVIPVHLVCV